MAAHPYISTPPGALQFDNTTTTTILQYKGTVSATPQMPALPPSNDTPTAHRFYSNLTDLLHGRAHKKVPHSADERMFVTIGLGLEPCGGDAATCAGPLGMRLAASMNNASFQLPTTLSMLQAHFSGVKGIYMEDFPDSPPVVFDYTNENVSLERLAYNATVEMVLQNTAILGVENHPRSVKHHSSANWWVGCHQIPLPLRTP